MEKIKWRVDKLDVQTPLSVSENCPVYFQAHVTGVREHNDLFGKKTRAEFVQALENRLNGENDPLPEIKNVIFNPPATIVFWSDNTKTVVKVQGGEPFDPEKGLAMALSKKALGNKGNYYNQIRKWTKNYNSALAALKTISDQFDRLKKMFMK